MKRCLRPLIAFVTFILSICIAPSKPSDNRCVSQQKAESAVFFNRSYSYYCPLAVMDYTQISPQKQSLSNSKLSGWELLLSLEGQDLKKFDEKSQVRIKKTINSLVGKQSKEELDYAIPRLVSKMSDESGQTLYILIQTYTFPFIPGRTILYAHIFDAERKMQGTSEFTTGGRRVLFEMNISYRQEIGRDELLINTTHELFGGNTGNQYYALVSGKLLLIRLEDACGQLERNNYNGNWDSIRGSYPDIGLSLAGRSAKEWEKSLESTDPAEVLATLTWLSGHHLNPRKPLDGLIRHPENAREAKLVEELRSSDSIKAKIDTLTKSDNKWLKQAAEFYTKIEYDN